MGLQTLYTAATGMMAAETNIDVIANNLANASTSSYKRRRAEFEDLLYLDKQRVGTQTSNSGTVRPTGAHIGLGATVSAIYAINEQGSMEKTDGSLDVAIDGRGFFRITLPTGEEAYTRAGAFQISGEGELVTGDGYTVSPGISIPSDATSITINEDGEVLATIDGQVDTSNLGQIELVSFVNEAGLRPDGNNLLFETISSGSPIVSTANQDGLGRVLQGFIEGSNVDTVSELTSLIKAQRTFEMNVKVMEKAEENAKTFNQAT